MTETEETVLCGLLLSWCIWSQDSNFLPHLFMLLKSCKWSQRGYRNHPVLLGCFSTFPPSSCVGHNRVFDKAMGERELTGQWDRGYCSPSLPNSYRILLWRGPGFTWELWYVVFHHTLGAWFDLARCSHPRHRCRGVEASVGPWKNEWLIMLLCVDDALWDMLVSYLTDSRRTELDRPVRIDEIYCFKAAPINTQPFFY